MSRKRYIKPELFKHEELLDAERLYQLPLRLAFIGLLLCCDQKGRFRWQARRLKLDVFPYEEIDFSRVLDALALSGFIVKYEHEGKYYGCVPSWSLHQKKENHEPDSILPDVKDAVILRPEWAPLSTDNLEPPVVASMEAAVTPLDASHRLVSPCSDMSLGKGKQGKGEEGKGNTNIVEVELRSWREIKPCTRDRFEPQSVIPVHPDLSQESSLDAPSRDVVLIFRSPFAQEQVLKTELKVLAPIVLSHPSPSFGVDTLIHPCPDMSLWKGRERKGEEGKGNKNIVADELRPQCERKAPDRIQELRNALRSTGMFSPKGVNSHYKTSLSRTAPLHTDVQQKPEHALWQARSRLTNLYPTQRM
jgi:hypothetical protein